MKNNHKYYNFYVITGGPGVGKSTLLHELESRGYRCIPEGARQIIQQEMRSGGGALPWGNIPAYKKKMLEYDIAAYKKALTLPEKIIFFDRGLLDLITYDHITDTKSAPELITAVNNMRYNKKVFILPPWKEIYQTDSERKQTYAESVSTYQLNARVYKEYGYEIIEVPPMDVKQRADFVIAAILK